MNTTEARGRTFLDERRRLEYEANMMRAEALVDALQWSGRVIARIFSPVTTLVNRVAVVLDRRRESDRIYSELSRMSDRDLADIGIARSDIHAVASGTYKQPDTQTGEVVVLHAKAPTQATQADNHTPEFDRAA